MGKISVARLDPVPVPEFSITLELTELEAVRLASALHCIEGDDGRACILNKLLAGGIEWDSDEVAKIFAGVAQSVDRTLDGLSEPASLTEIHLALKGGSFYPFYDILDQPREV